MMFTPLSRRISASARLVAAAIGLFAATGVLAKQSDRDQPMDVHADTGNMFLKANSTTTITGSVTITQGTMTVTGDKAKIYAGPDNDIVRVLVTGHPAHIEQLDDNGNLMQGDAATLDYDNVKAIAVLTGQAVVRQKGRGEAHGDKLTYDTRTSEMVGESNGSNQLHMIFQPKKRPATATPAASSDSTPAPAASSSQP
jgi:lipopolysaccharide export system protein LptA